jgi:hypothetical protein
LFYFIMNRNNIRLYTNLISIKHSLFSKSAEGIQNMVNSDLKQRSFNLSFRIITYFWNQMPIRNYSILPSFSSSQLLQFFQRISFIYLFIFKQSKYQKIEG